MKYLIFIILALQFLTITSKLICWQETVMTSDGKCSNKLIDTPFCSYDPYKNFNGACHRSWYANTCKECSMGINKNNTVTNLIATSESCGGISCRQGACKTCCPEGKILCTKCFAGEALCKCQDNGQYCG